MKRNFTPKILVFFAYFLFFGYLILANIAVNAQSVSGSVTTNGCKSGGAITANSTGLGATPQYQLLLGSQVIAPANNDATQFTNNPSFTGLLNGGYVIKARADGGSTPISSSTITVNNGYVDMSLSSSSKVLNCIGGTTTLTAAVTGGKANYIYSIALQSSPNTPIATSASTTATSYTFGTTTPLPKEDYVISITDNCGVTVTSAAVISNPTSTVNDIKIGGLSYVTRTAMSCANPITFINELGWRYVSSNNPVTGADATRFTWKIKFQGVLYGKDADGDGDSDVAGDGIPISTPNMRMPNEATRNLILADYANMQVILSDGCGNTKAFPIIDYNTQQSSLTARSCGTDGQIKSIIGAGLACLPLNIKFTNTSIPSDVINVSQTSSVQTFGGFTPGASYSYTYQDGEGYTTGLFRPVTPNPIVIPMASQPTLQQNFYGQLQSLNYLDYAISRLTYTPGKEGDLVTVVVTASNNVLVPVGHSATVSLSAYGDATLPAINASDPTGFWPDGNYTIQASGPCGTASANFVVNGYTASITGNTITPICGGFNYVLNGDFDTPSAYEVVIVSGPSNIGQTRNMANTSMSLPFNGLNPGDYVFGVRIKGGTRFVYNQNVSYSALDVIKIDRSLTGGYVCNASDANGTLTIAASSISPSPNDVLQYSLGGNTLTGPYSAFQSSNIFTGLTYGTYYFKVKDGCGNLITESTQIGVAATPTAVVNGSTIASVCKSSTGTVQLDVDVLGATNYTWTGPGINSTNQILKNPVVNIADLAVGTNTFNLTITTSCGNSTATSSVTVNDLPTVTIANPTAVCSPSTVDLTASAVTSGSSPGLTFTYFTNASATTPLTNPNAISISNTYYIKGFNGTCSDIKPVVVTINQPINLALISLAGTDAQSKCINTAITNITYSVTNGTNATVIGLPAGVTGTYNAGVFTISGTPTAAGTFNYTVTATGTCVSATATGTITVNPNASIALTSATGTDAQSKCINTAITNITYSVTNGTNATVTGLPAGVTGTYNAGVFTISGTPTAAGTFNYTVTATGTCVSATATGTITVNPNASTALTSATGTDAQSKCINTAITNITYSVTNGTNATVTGLPAGVTGTYNAGVFTISGTPRATGNFNYTITAMGICVSATATGTLTINPNVSTALTSAIGTDAQSKCINTAITNITYSVTNGTNATVTGLPAGVTGTYNAGVFTISGTPRATGNFNYTVTATGICVSATATGTITVNPNASTALTSATGTDAQSKCINTAITNITYSVTNGTNATVTGLPAGVTGTYNAGVFTISGTPRATGNFNYTVTATGICVSATATGILTINPNVSTALTSAIGTDAQSKCINTAITNITYSVTNGTNATVTGLPAGVTGTYNAGVFTISGTPRATGNFNYTITATGICVSATATGTLTVNSNVSTALTSAIGTDEQSKCINTAITNITYSVTNGTNATVTGLPAGVTGTYNAGVFTISGTPRATGNFNYTITATGICVSATATGTITVNPNASTALTSATGTDAQSKCINTAITNITYSVTNGTNATVTGLPAGVTGTYNAGVFTISGTPRATGNFNYTITATGICASIQINGSLVVNALPTPIISSNLGVEISQGDVITLTATGGITYQWTGNDIQAGQNSSTLTARPNQTSTYTVIATNASGCSSVVTISLKVNKDYKLEPNNVISPNGDGKNDTWVIKNIDYYPNNKVKIFDRAGRLIYFKNGYKDDWNGTYEGRPLNEDAYYYVIDLGVGVRLIRGSIALIRDNR